MEEVVSVITVCVTLLLGVAGFIINSFVQRKSNSIQIITKTRLNRRSKTKEFAANLIKVSSIDYISSLDDKNEAIREAIDAASKIRSEYSRVFLCDRDLIALTDNLVNSIVAYVHNSKEIEENKLLSARDEFIRCTDLYFQTEWKRIKLETVGKYNNNNYDSWETIHKYYTEEYDK
ncbi:MAG: hypothetical protein K5923_02765 [Clostridia bacterium]|nr:hypothetical protein [Clostridia bacterium]